MSAAERSEARRSSPSRSTRAATRPATVAHFLAVHEMTGRMQYLIGSAAALHARLGAPGASRPTPTPSNPDVVEHSALIYGITGARPDRVVEPANFTPRAIVHDAALLARA